MKYRSHLNARPDLLTAKLIDKQEAFKIMRYKPYRGTGRLSKVFMYELVRPYIKTHPPKPP